MKKNTWLTRLLALYFPNKPKIQFRLNILFVPFIHVFLGIIIPSLHIDKIVTQIVGGMTFVMVLPLSIYCFSLFLLSFIISIEDVEYFISKYGQHLLGWSYIPLLPYLIYTLTTDAPGGFLLELWFKLVEPVY